MTTAKRTPKRRPECKIVVCRRDYLGLKRKWDTRGGIERHRNDDRDTVFIVVGSGTYDGELMKHAGDFNISFGRLLSFRSVESTTYYVASPRPRANS